MTNTAINAAPFIVVASPWQARVFTGPASGDGLREVERLLPALRTQRVEPFAVQLAEYLAPLIDAGQPGDPPSLLIAPAPLGPLITDYLERWLTAPPIRLITRDLSRGSPAAVASAIRQQAPSVPARVARTGGAAGTGGAARAAG